MSSALRAWLALFAVCAGCGGPVETSGGGHDESAIEAPREARPAEPRTVTLSIVGTNDLHGHITALPLLAGYLANLRAARERDGGAVLVIDGGDMFQGTLESNIVEGASVILGMNALGYTAAAVGNHEFDYGPVGNAVTPAGPGDDARGALIARAAEAQFPILAANIIDSSTGRVVAWHPNVRPTVLLDAAGVRVGIVGLTTPDTPRMTNAGNVRDISFAPLAETAAREAEALRARGAVVRIVTAHAGGRCEDCSHPEDTSSCLPDQEIFAVANALPAGTVDVIVAGHTHRGVAHRVNGIAIIESFAYGLAFGRVDVTVDRERGVVVDTRIHPPRSLCADESDAFDTCDPGEYEGAAVTRDEVVARRLAPFLVRAQSIESRPLSVEVVGDFSHDFDRESALGNLLADLIRAGVRSADVGLMNGGGIRDGISAGSLSYGEFYRVFPFDNRWATARLTGAELAEVVRESVSSDRGFMALSGVRARARCRDGVVDVELRRDNGRRVRDGETLVVAASDFLAMGGSEVLGRALADGRVTIDEGEPMREKLVELIAWRMRIDPADPRLFDPRRPRVTIEGERPLRCAEAAPATEAP